MRLVNATLAMAVVMASACAKSPTVISTCSDLGIESILEVTALAPRGVATDPPIDTCHVTHYTLG